MKFINDINLPLDIYNEEHIRHLKALSDGKLYTEDRCEFAIHRCLLAAKSRYFYIIFCKVDINRTDILIPGIKGEILEEILSYLYTNDIEFTHDNIADILLTSNYLFMDDLVMLCEAYARYNISSCNCLKMFSTAYYLNHKDIYRHSFRILRLHFETVFSRTNSEIEELPVDALKHIISCDNLSGRTEDFIWSVIVTWIGSDKYHRQVYLPELIMYLKVTRMDELLATIIAEHDIVRNNPCFSEITKMKATGSYSSNLEILQTFYSIHSRSNSEICNLRLLPPKLYIFVHAETTGEDDNRVHYILFITYDENINIWRKICDSDFYPSYITSFQGWIYAMDCNNEIPFRFERFNLIENGWILIKKPKTVSYAQVALEHKGLIYFFGCRTYSEIANSRVFTYNPSLSTWTETSRMFSVVSPSVASSDGKIYVIGSSPNDRANSEDIIIFQVYHPEINTWNRLSSFSLDSGIEIMSIKSNHSKLYVIIETCPPDLYVEPIHDPELTLAWVYDPIEVHWRSLPDLPPSYFIDDHSNLNDQVIICGYNVDVEDRVLRWNDYIKQWEIFEESSSLKNLYEFGIFSIESKESIDIFTKENRKMFTGFEESPFKQEASA